VAVVAVVAAALVVAEGDVDDPGTMSDDESNHFAESRHDAPHD
jgi:hypothetical protein